MAEQARPELAGVNVERSQHGLGVPRPRGPPVAYGQGDQRGEQCDEEPGPRVGVRVDALAAGALIAVLARRGNTVEGPTRASDPGVRLMHWCTISPRE